MENTNVEFDRAGIKNLYEFVNDKSWLDHYQYSFFTHKEIASLYYKLKEQRKLNLNRELLIAFATSEFPHRKKSSVRSSLKVKFSLVLGSIITFGLLGTLWALS